VVEMVPEDYVQNAVTLNTAVMTSSRVVGPAIAGLLVITAGYPWCFTIDALSYLAVLAGLLMMRPAELRQPPVTPRGKRQVREGIRYVRSVTELWAPLLMAAFLGVLAYNFPVVLPLFAEHTLHGSDSTYTLMYSVLSVGSVAGALAAAHRKVIDMFTIAFASFAFGVSMLVFAIMPNLQTAFPIVLAVGFTSVLFMTGSTAIVQVRADSKMRGRVLALQAIVFIGSTPIGGPILGAVCDRFGARAGIAVGGVAALLAAAWGRGVAVRMREGREAADRHGAPHPRRPILQAQR
jgi:predicted MFS family arabinose efflux permease